MLKNNFILISAIVLLALTPAMIGAQEFGVAVGRDTTFSAGAAFGNTSGIVVVLGDTLSQYNVTAQLVYPPTTLIGNRISIGRTAIFPGPSVAFDGTNYLVVWTEFNGNLNGQFVNQSGGLVGGYFTIGTNVNLDRPGQGVLYGDTTYMVGYIKTDSSLYGQVVGKSGNLIGGPVRISNNHARSLSGAFDGTNFLAAWVEVIPDRDKDVWGQFVSKNGSLVGSNFLIDGGPLYSDNPTSMAFDGTRYLLCYHESSNNATNIYGRFITTSGSIEQTILLADSTNGPHMPSIAFDGTNYLITWTQTSSLAVFGRFWNPAGVPSGSPFVVFDTLNNRLPFAGCGFGGDYFLVVGTRVNMGFTDGDVYGRFIYRTGIEEENAQKPGEITLLQSHPNPFTSFTAVPGYEKAEFALYDAMGRMVGVYPGSRIGADLAPGVYFARGEDSKTAAIRIVKIK